MNISVMSRLTGPLLLLLVLLTSACTPDDGVLACVRDDQGGLGCTNGTLETSGTFDPANSEGDFSELRAYRACAIGVMIADPDVSEADAYTRCFAEGRL